MAAQRGILVETCQALLANKVEYVIAGGWVPYLRVMHSAVKHPGTNDVDVLFNDKLEPLKLAVKALLDAGYVPSAKHPFQLLKRLNVDEEPFVFNVDLMHPVEQARDENMFQDIIDLGVKDDYDSEQTHIIKSISFPSSRIIFDENLWSNFEVEATLPNGQIGQISIPLMDECGLILSKCAIVGHPKRSRDAFDIYYILASTNGPETAEKLRHLAIKYIQVNEQLDLLNVYLENNSGKFDSRVNRHAGAGHLLHATDLHATDHVRDLLFH